MSCKLLIDKIEIEYDLFLKWSNKVIYKLVTIQQKNDVWIIKKSSNLKFMLNIEQEFKTLGSAKNYVQRRLKKFIKKLENSVIL